VIDLYYWTTPNGHKITIFLEATVSRPALTDRKFADSPVEGAVHCELVSETRTQIRC